MGKVHESDVNWEQTSQGNTSFHRKRLSKDAGGDELGCSLYEIPPGARSWPFHFHNANEEAIYVLEGKAMLRLPDESITIEAGDYVALPCGEEYAHRVINNSNTRIRYLAISTMRHPEVVVYPDSDKIGITTGSAPGDHEHRNITKYFHADEDVSYWDGES